MVQARQIDSQGNDIKGTERWFTEEHFSFMVEHWGKYLRWKRVEDEKPQKTKKQTIKTNQDNEETDLSLSDGIVPDPVSD